MEITIIRLFSHSYLINIFITDKYLIKMPPIETNLTDLFHHVTVNSSNNEFDSHIGNVHIFLSSCCKYSISNKSF